MEEKKDLSWDTVEHCDWQAGPEITAASVQGGDHAYSLKNCQDSFAVNTAALGNLNRLSVGIIADGCGEASKSEYGAIFWCHVFLREFCNKAILNNLLGFSPEEAAKGIMTHFSLVAKNKVETIRREMGRFPSDMPFMSQVAWIAQHLLATTWVVIDSDIGTWILACGDGALRVSWGEHHYYNVEDQKGRPLYAAYAGFHGRDMERQMDVPPSELPPLKCFFFRKASRIAVGTDGAIPLLDKDDVWEKAFSFKGKRDLQRWMNSGHPNFRPAAAQNKRWAVSDDATLLLLRRPVDENVTFATSNVLVWEQSLLLTQLSDGNYGVPVPIKKRSDDMLEELIPTVRKKITIQGSSLPFGTTVTREKTVSEYSADGTPKTFQKSPVVVNGIISPLPGEGYKK